ncbi:MAG TPA: type II toxin-antitoxin system Phd/YefM family antitoxin [Patescibacteria group bacterium]
MTTKSTTLRATEARRKFFEILKDIDKLNRVYTITLDGRLKAVILSVDEYESWLETMDIMKNSKLMKDIKESAKKFKKGEYQTLEEVLAEEGFVAINKTDQYEISSDPGKKGRKKSKKNR